MPRKSGPSAIRKVCFVTGTRAEFGLMQNMLRAIRTHPKLQLQLIVTGMHLDPVRGQTINEIRTDGWKIDATVPWTDSGANLGTLAQQTGEATAQLAAAYSILNPDIVLVVGDRVEAFAAATAAHLSGKIVAHVHGGDRALGQVDDALRHAITKLSHLHFPATKKSAQRIAKLGEDRWRIHQVGAPGIDRITEDAWPIEKCTELLKRSTTLGLSSDESPLSSPYILFLYHPTDSDEQAEYLRVKELFEIVSSRLPRTNRQLIVYPNNDPGAGGIVRYWDGPQHRKYRATPEQLSRQVFIRSLPRSAFLGILRHASILIGNSSSGILEAGSFGTPVIDVGPRQQGRERGANVTSVPFRKAAIRSALKDIWNSGRPKRFPFRNIYGAGDTSKKIAKILASVPLDEKLRRKLIAY